MGVEIDLTQRARIFQSDWHHEFVNCINSNINNIEPTYWPTDGKKIPDLLDFGITKGISKNSSSTESCLDLSSDHSPIIIRH